MSQYLRVYVEDLALLLHYQQVLEVGDWLFDGRVPREAAWREHTLPVLALAKQFDRVATSLDVFVVVETAGQQLMLLVERIDSLVGINEAAFSQVMDADVIATRLLDQACYREKDDCIYWRIRPDALVDALHENHAVS